MVSPENIQVTLYNMLYLGIYRCVCVCVYTNVHTHTYIYMYTLHQQLIKKDMNEEKQEGVMGSLEEGKGEEKCN